MLDHIPFLLPPMGGSARVHSRRRLYVAHFLPDLSGSQQLRAATDPAGLGRSSYYIASGQTWRGKSAINAALNGKCIFEWVNFLCLITGGKAYLFDYF